jgi:hypothetical protein
MNTKIEQTINNIATSSSSRGGQPWEKDWACSHIIFPLGFKQLKKKKERKLKNINTKTLNYFKNVLIVL